MSDQQQNRESYEARFRGQRGEQGEKGERGEGITRGARYAVVFLFVLSFLLAAGSYGLSTAAVRRAVSSRASVVQLCQLGNESRAQQVTLWERLVAISPPPPHQTPAQARAREKLISEFLGFVRREFAPRNCTRTFSQEAVTQP